MAFPTTLDTFTNPVAGGPGVGTEVATAGVLLHSSQHGALNDAMEFVQAKIGVDGSAVTSTLDYKLATAFPLGYGAWTAYTTTWSGTSTNPSIGNGSLAAAWGREIRTIHYRIALTIGSTTTFGSGAWQFTLPTTPVGGNYPCGQMRILDASPSDQYILNLFQNGGALIAGIGSTASSYVSPTSPITFASGDSLFLAGTYESST